MTMSVTGRGEQCAEVGAGAGAQSGEIAAQVPAGAGAHQLDGIVESAKTTPRSMGGEGKRIALDDRTATEMASENEGERKRGIETEGGRHVRRLAMTETAREDGGRTTSMTVGGAMRIDAGGETEVYRVWDVRCPKLMLQPSLFNDARTYDHR